MCLVDGRAGKTLLAPVLRAPSHPLSLCEASMPWRRGPATRGRLQGPSLCSWEFALPLLGAVLAALWESAVVMGRASVLALTFSGTEGKDLNVRILRAVTKPITVTG